MSWPVRCPSCGDWTGMSFRSDRTGNARRYSCGKCGAVRLATLKGFPSGSAMAEPRNVDSKDMEWVRVMR